MNDSSGHRKRKCVSLRRLLHGVLLMSAAAAALLFLLTTPPGEGMLRRSLEKRIGAATGWDLRIGSLKTNVVGHLRIRDLLLRDGSSRSADSLLVVEEADVFYRLFDLLGRRPSLSRIKIEGLYNHPSFIRRLSNLSGGDNPEKPVRLRVNAAEIRRSSLRYADSRLPLNLAGEGFRARGNRERGVFFYRIAMDSLSVEFGGRSCAFRLAVAGRWGEDRLVADSLSLAMTGMETSGSGIVDLRGDIPVLASRLEFRVDPARFPYDRFGIPPGGMRPSGGTISGSLDIGGGLESPRILARARGTGLGFGGTERAAFDLEARITRESASLERMDLSVFGGRVAASGLIRFDRAEVGDFRLGVESVDVRRFLAALHGREIPLGGVLGGQAEVSGSLRDREDLRIRGDGRLAFLPGGEREYTDFLLQGAFRKRAGRVTVSQADSRIDLDFSLGEGAVRGTAAASLPRVHVWTALLGFEDVFGRARAEASFVLDGSGFGARGRVSGGSLAVHGFPVDTAAADLTYDRNVLSIRSAIASARYTAGTDRRSFPGVEGFDGSFGYEARFAGTLREGSGVLHAWTGRASLGAMALDTASLDLRLQGEDLSLERLYCGRDSLALHGRGSYHLTSEEGDFCLDFIRGNARHAYESRTEGFGRLEASISGLDGEWRIRGEEIELAAAEEFLPEIGGRMEFRGEFRAPWSRPTAEVRVSVREARFRGMQADSVRCGLALEDTTVILHALEIHAAGLTSRAEVRAGIGRPDGFPAFREAGRFLGRAEGSDVDLRLLGTLFPRFSRFEGRGRFRLSWDGTFRRPGIRGGISLEGGLFQAGPRSEPVRDVLASLVVSDTLLIIESLRGRIGPLPFGGEGRLARNASGRFGIEASLRVREERVLELRCDAAGDSLAGCVTLDSLDLSLLRPWLPMLGRLEGRMHAGLLLSGTIRDPEVYGRAAAAGLGFRNDSFPLTVENGSFRADFRGSAVYLDSLHLPVGRGSLALRGNLVRQDSKIRGIEASLRGRGIRVEKSKAYLLNIQSLQLSLEGDGGTYGVSGDIVLGETRWMQNVQPPAIAASLRRQDPAGGSPSFLHRLRMDVRLMQSNRLWLDNNLGRVRLHPEMRLVGTAGRPVLSGRLTAEEGYVFYLDRKLRLQRGIADFTDPHRINPVLDISAEAQVRATRTVSQTPYTVTLGVTGPAERAVVTLTSDPPLDRGEIVALMTLGVTRAQWKGTDASTSSGFGLFLRDRAEELTGGFLTGYAARRVGDLLGMETVSIEGNLFRFGTNWGPQLLASKRLTNRMEIRYSTTIGHANEQSFRLDYRLNEYFSFQGQTDQRGNAGIDLNYRIRLR